jgi:predicted dithiol-disulfide oxidoreductase (DUF899 family)
MTNNTQIENHQVVTRDEWLAARREFLSQEKEFTRRRDELTAARRALPWVRLEKDYVFETAAGPRSLAELFDGRSQLAVYHFMFGPEWEAGCPSCSFIADTTLNGSFLHLAQRDVTLIAVSRAPLEKLEAYKKRLGWEFQWVSSHDNDFNRDFHVSFTPEEMVAGEMFYNFHKVSFPNDEAPGFSAFYKNPAGEIFHTYSSYARGLDAFIGAYHYLDLVPKGRDEDELGYTMEWVRQHDRYDEKYFAKSSAAQNAPAAHDCCGAEGKAA